MAKLTSRDILNILRRFEVANDDHVPRHIERLKITNPNPINTMAEFLFGHTKYFALLDETAEDDEKYILEQIQSGRGEVKGELLLNPTASTMTYGLPYQSKHVYLYVVKSDKTRLDVFLGEKYPELSRSTWQKYIKLGYVSVNGRTIEAPRQEVSEADKVAINLPEKPDYSKDELPIVYIDDDVVVINKPIGVLSHAKGEIGEEFTVADFFKRYTTYGLDTNRPGIVHRLDRDTSGIIIGARTPDAAKYLQKQFASRKVKKTYYAILNGIPKLDKANLDLPIERNQAAPSTFRVGASGKSALTRYDVIDTNEKFALVKLQPQTGRTHQLRVHMKYINTPILGDKVYGAQAERLYLHSYSLEITLPSGQRQTFFAPLPEEFVKLFPEAQA